MAHAFARGGQPELTYTLQHITRHFIIAADGLATFNYDTIKLLDIEAFMPDGKKQTESIRKMSLSSIKRDFGLDPLYLSCK